MCETWSIFEQIVQKMKPQSARILIGELISSLLGLLFGFIPLERQAAISKRSEEAGFEQITLSSRHYYGPF